jgi:hypothetical protein
VELAVGRRPAAAVVDLEGGVREAGGRRVSHLQSDVAPALLAKSATRGRQHAIRRVDPDHPAEARGDREGEALIAGAGVEHDLRGAPPH